MTFRAIIVGLGKVFIWGFVILAMIYGVLWAINAEDEELSLEAKSLLAIPQINADPANGYLALVGMNAPADENIFSYGSRWVDAFNVSSNGIVLFDPTASIFTSDGLKFLGDSDPLCNPSKGPCLPQAKKDADLWRSLAAKNEVLVARQRSLTDYSHFEESYFPPSLDSPVPTFADPSRLLVIDLIALDAEEGNLEQALTALDARTAFDRRALLGSRSLIMGMVATSWIKQDYALLAEIVGTRSPKLVAQKSRLDRMTELLTIDQIRNVAGRIYEGDSRVEIKIQSQAILPAMESVTEEPVEASNWGSMRHKLLNPFNKQQATKNFLAHLQSSFLTHIKEFSPESAEIWIDKDVKDQQGEIDAVIHSPKILYNPIGKLNVYKAREHHELYIFILRLSDLIGITRLTHLQVEVITTGVVDVDIPAYIAADKALYDPYTDKPMGWDAGNRQLYFDDHTHLIHGKSNHIKENIW